ncbi:response regulator [Dyadobacter sp. CY107]|uniref:response regulator n=1 Tax=Dyadobacter fanqingshengii TaxID=2906443 RepID=UPI001F1A45DA|nr:response regulator [Dyadobacter fanqingshengii]MCF2502596.1 response regulator [Dyadobacter fanqingshengii]
MNKVIVIVDDDPIVRLVIQRMVHNIDSSITCHQCENGEVGLLRIELQNITDYIVVLLDINMPVLNGWEFLDRLQQLNIVASDKFKLYMITSSTDASDKIKARSYPVIKKLYPKPLSKQDLKEILISNEMP